MRVFQIFMIQIGHFKPTKKRQNNMLDINFWFVNCCYKIIRISHTHRVTIYRHSNLCRIYRLRGSTKCLGSDFRGSEWNFTIGQSPKIYGNFSKICIKISKNLKNYRENSRKNANFSEFFNFQEGDYGKYKEYNTIML